MQDISRQTDRTPDRMALQKRIAVVGRKLMALEKRIAAVGREIAALEQEEAAARLS